MDDFDIEENAFYDICNFIDQEIYVLAVRSSFLGKVRISGEILLG
ncbi:hypothetical protein [Klebsiella pneumoniae]|nr:hypothetical protein [Klebsiella pneumoniae]